MSSCLTCGSTQLKHVLDLGMQPVSSHFVSSSAEASKLHPLALAVCENCGVVQLRKPISYTELIPPYDWITYREPETHLDSVVDRLLALDSVGPESAIVGLSFKDATALERFRMHGFSRIRSINAQQDLGAPKAEVGVESIQALLTPERAKSFVARHGLADLVIARHVLEHAEQPIRFMKALATLLAPGGYLVIEVPDCRANLDRRDYTMIWEEHVLYFTPETVRQNLATVGCVPVSCDIYHFPFEDVIVLCARKMGEDVVSAPPIDATASARNAALAEAFGRDFATWTGRYRALFERMTANGKSLAAYGAGHLTEAFLHFHDVAGFFACVIDDTPQKQGLLLPKSGLPILDNERLAAGDISHCLFGLAPQIEDKVIAKNGAFTARGGEFYSMFVDSPRSIRKLIAS